MLAAEVMWPDVVTAIGTAATTVLLAVAGLIAAGQLSEARSLRRGQTRPFVVIEFDPQSKPPFIDVRILNLGTTMARDVTFEFDKPLVTQRDEDERGPRVAELSIFTDGIPSLPPGGEIRFFYDSFIGRDHFPDKYEVKVRYLGEEVRRWPRRAKRETYEDRLTMDLGIYRRMPHITLKGVHDVHERLKEVRDEMKKWTASGRGLLRLSPDEVKAREKEWEQSKQARRPETLQEGSAEETPDSYDNE